MKKAMLIILAVLLSTALCFVSCKQDPPQPEPQPAHTHTFAEEWTKNETHHWHAATCEHADEKSGYAEHTWDAGVVSTEPTMTTDGVKTYTCTVCGQTKQESVQKLAICVSTFADFVQAFTDIREQGETRTTIYLTADLEWDATTYNKDNAFTPDMTGITLDLNNHSITGMISTAFAPTGNTFTIKNGTLSLVSATNTYQKAISVGFSTTLTGKDYTTEAEQAKAITFDGVSFNASPYLGDGVFIFNDCMIIGANAKNNRGLVCYSGYVELNNTTVRSQKHGTDAAEVAIYVQETVLKLNDGTVVDSASHGIQLYNNSSLSTTGTVSITCQGNYGIYTFYNPATLLDETGYGNTVNIGSGTTVSGDVKGVFALTWGDVVTIASGATLVGPKGVAEPKYDTPSITAAVGTASTTGYIGWSKCSHDTGTAATITDNRVLD